MSLQVYTDGSASPNPGKGGAGAVFIKDDKIILELLYSEKGITTNNRMELYAVIMALYYVPPDEPVNIYTDSSYVCEGITKWIHEWKRTNWKNNTIKNIDLWKLLNKRCGANVTINWVKGHNDNKWNEHADRLAKEGAGAMNL